MIILRDNATKTLISITNDAFVANHLAEGILDLEYLYSDLSKPLFNKISNLMNRDVDVGIKLTDDDYIECNVDTYILYKLNLAKIRKPVFELLQKLATDYINSLRVGFIRDDEFILHTVLDNDRLIDEYAITQNISKDFAKKEIRLLTDSYIKQRFRLFVNCSKWKLEINNCKSSAEIEKIRQAMSDSFWISGIPRL